MTIFRKIIALISFLLLISSNSPSQIWEKTSDPPIGVNQFKIALAYEGNNTLPIILSNDGAGIFKSTDEGIIWENIGLVGKGLTGFYDNQVNSDEYYVTASDGFYKTLDGGSNWTQHNSGIEGLFITDITNGYGVDEYYLGTVGNGVYRSFDGGQTWAQFGTGLENKTVTSVKFIYFTEEDDGLYAVTQEDGAYSYNFNTNTWVPINDGNNNLFGTTSVSGNSQAIIFLAISTGVLSSPSDPVFWQIEINFDFANDFALTLDDQIFASSFGGGVKQRESFANWNNFSDGLPSDGNGYIHVGNIECDQDGYLWAAVIPLDPTVAGGCFKSVNPVTDVYENTTVSLDNFDLSQNYPNPFNPATTIQYSISQQSDVVLKIYDVLGNQIETLVNEEKPVGSYELNWYAENLPSGVYFYQLRAGDFISTKRMVLMK